MVTDREILEAVLAEVRGLGTRMDGLESRMDGLDSRMDGLDSRMNGLDARMDGAGFSDGENGEAPGAV